MLEQRYGHNRLFRDIDDFIVALSWGLWAFLFFDFAWYTPNDIYGFGNWHLNPVWDFMYLRIGGPFLYGNHIITAIFLLSIPIYFVIKEKSYKRMPNWLVLTFATIFIHEIFIQVFSAPVYGWGKVYFQVFSVYMIVLLIFFLIGIKIGNKFQRRALKRIVLVCGVSIGITELFYGLLNYHPMTLAEFHPGPQVYSFIPNLIENVLWLLPILVWYYEDIERFVFWKIRIKDLHLHNWLRYYLFYRSVQVPIKTDAKGKFDLLKEWNEWEKEYIPKGGLQGKTVLDVGAGSGETACFFFKHGASKVICIEPIHSKCEEIRDNAKQLQWNVEIRDKKFTLSDLEGQIDFAKIDCEGGEKILLDTRINILFPFCVEIHSLELVEEFKKRFPEMEIRKKYLILSTWLGKYAPRTIEKAKID